jgi:hypothetical protein
MVSFLIEIFRRRRGRFTVLVMDDAQLEAPSRYQLVGGRLIGGVAAVAGLVGLLMVSVVVFTPLRELIPGYGTAEMHREVRLAALRLAAVQDSIEAQYQYVSMLRGLMIGQLDSLDLPLEQQVAAMHTPASRPSIVDVDAATVSRSWADHEQPAIVIDRLPLRSGERSDSPVLARYLSSIRFPLAPPVTGFFSRGFDARSGHFAVDIAVEEGTVVRSVGDGYVVMADWTHEGGYTLVVQHADGFVTVYKHNSRLLKRAGDRVREREAIALSGNTGAITTGPHLHFELWHNGLAQDPRSVFIGG